MIIPMVSTVIVMASDIYDDYGVGTTVASTDPVVRIPLIWSDYYGSQL